MQIIFTENKEEFDGRYVLLELETFLNSEGTPKTAYCALPSGSFVMNELADFDRYCRLHQAVIDALKRKDLATAKEGISHLAGKFNGELDTFYAAMIHRYNLHD